MDELGDLKPLVDTVGLARLEEVITIEKEFQSDGSCPCLRSAECWTFYYFC